MKRTLLAILATCGLVTMPGWAANYGAVQAPHPRPASIQVLLPAMVVGDTSYTFEIVLIETKAKTGQPQVRATTTIAKTADGKTIRLKEIAQVVQVDATQFTVTADGQEFVFEAGYTEASAADGVPPREIQTTFQQMFSGGPVGIKVRLP
jgi:hypothetical protein